MTQVIRKVPAVLLAVIVAAVMCLAVGAMTAQTVYAKDVQLNKICFEGSDAWGHTYPVDGEKEAKTLEDLNITVLDKAGQVVPADKYDMKIYLTWWDDAAAEDKYIEITDNRFSLRKESTEGYSEGYAQYEVRVEAKAGSGYAGEAEPNQFFITDTHSLSWINAKKEFKDYSKTGEWRMHTYYMVPVGKVQEVMVTACDGTVLTKNVDYKATYYVRGDTSTDDWDIIWSEDNPVDGLPTEIGHYFVKVEGIGSYYSQEIVNLDIMKDASQDHSKYVTVKAKKKSPAVVKFAKVKKANQIVPVSKLISSKVSLFRYEKAGGSKKLTIDEWTGKVKVKKGTKKGTYNIKIKVWPSGTNEYLLGEREVTCYIRVK